MIRRQSSLQRDNDFKTEYAESPSPASFTELVVEQLEGAIKQLMNAFQKQLLLRDGKNMAELSNPHRDGIGQPLPPQKISIEQFEADKPERQSKKREVEHG